MTRATLLHLLAHPTALNGADVRALEALAEAFPYCQTAHLLLAKAAHDQDSMLAGQRLRRAATYAADRTLLRQLIEQTPAVVAAEAATAGVAHETASPGSHNALADQPVAPYSAELPATSPATLSPLADYPTPELVAASVATPALVAAAPPAVAEPIASATPPATTASATPEQLEPLAAAEPATDAPGPAALAPVLTPVDEALPTPEAAPTLEVAPAETAPPETTPTAEATPAAAPGPVAAARSAAPDETAALLTDAAPAAAVALPDSDATEAAHPGPETAEAAPAQEARPVAVEVAPDEVAPDEVAPEPEAELPAQAPPVRPPEQAETARHEFGLASPEAAELAPYRLPELELAITVPLAAGPATPRLPTFSGVPDVAYAPGEGSRLGFCLVPAAGDEPDQVPPTRLPPAGEFFAPDALLTEYVAAPPAPVPNPLDLIDSFLQRNAAAPRRRPQPPPAGHQADLAARSTRAVPELASESLALILVRQGKIEQAITIYERLMVKNPEKMAYFAAQIDQLRPSA